MFRFVKCIFCTILCYRAQRDFNVSCALLQVFIAPVAVFWVSHQFTTTSLVCSAL